MNKLIGVGLCLLLVSCSLSQNPVILAGKLQPHIRADGTKLFLYTSINHIRLPHMKAKPRHQARHQARQARTSSPQTDGREKLKKQIYVALEEQLQKTEYCRTGYMKLGSFIERGQFEIRGECNEVATKQDKVRFPNTKMGNYH